MLRFGHGHLDRSEIVGWIGDQGRGLCLLRESTWLACRMLGNMVVWDICILEIRLAPTGRRVMGRTEGKLGGRKG
jgi:hypothetical protein